MSNHHYRLRQLLIRSPLRAASLSLLLGVSACGTSRERASMPSVPTKRDSALRVARSTPTAGRPGETTFRLVYVYSDLTLPQRSSAGPEGDSTCASTIYGGEIAFKDNRWHERLESSYVCDPKPNDPPRKIYRDSGTFRRVGDTLWTVSSSDGLRTPSRFLLQGDTLAELPPRSRSVYVLIP